MRYLAENRCDVAHILEGSPGLYFGCKRGTPLSHSNGSSLRAELCLVPALSRGRKRDGRPDWHDLARGGAVRALLRAVGALKGAAHCPLSRPVGLNVSLWLALGAYLSWLGGLSSPAVGRRVRVALHLAFLSGIPLGACGSRR